MRYACLFLLLFLTACGSSGASLGAASAAVPGLRADDLVGGWSAEMHAAASKPRYTLHWVRPGKLPGFDGYYAVPDVIYADQRMASSPYNLIYILSHELSHLEEYRRTGRLDHSVDAACVQNPQNYAYGYNLTGQPASYVCSRTEIRARRYSRLYWAACADRSANLGVPEGRWCDTAPDPSQTAVVTDADLRASLRPAALR
ncbi:hypothetical protein [Deinobacterium chartae]|nr:hypothetical protein [Deinobacterium chartae]